ncbi:hypothetical protein [Bowmanella denitrificans]|uniref:hypothetical protein n=1 Tax=Bowmanella denitrificans TaxID=366582 RepID=UPI000C99ECC6|nr:hypothetical protein [Bowmanella denitrificans]
MRTRLTQIAALLLLSSGPVLATSDAYVQPRLNTNIADALNTLGQSCQNFTLDTESDHAFEISDHHQSMTLSHRFSNGSALAFVSHSETGNGDYGQIMAFRVSASQFTNGSDLIGKDQTLPMTEKLFITEQHPSGIAWLPAPQQSGRDRGYLIIASENENKVRIRQFSQEGDEGEIATLANHPLGQITDVWLAQEGGNNWLILHNMNAGTGAAYKANTADLFQYGTSAEGELDINAFTLVNQYQSPANTGCGKSVGQNAQLVKDSTNNWYVVHTYTGENICGANSGNNIVKAYRAYFNADGTFSLATSTTPYAQTTVGSSSLPDGRGADGAAGFRVSEDGRLVAYYGGQYAYMSWFDWKTAVKECRSAAR